VQLHAADPDSDELKAGHVKQAADDALSALYVPGVQAVTLLPLPVYPASARHPLSVAVPVLFPVPEWVGQVPQLAADRTASLNVSNAHASTPAPRPVKPATPTQSFSSSDEPRLLLFAEEPVTPLVAELAGQSVHAAAPVSAL
jgi:hypothetical protein